VVLVGDGGRAEENVHSSSVVVKGGGTVVDVGGRDVVDGCAGLGAVAGRSKPLRSPRRELEVEIGVGAVETGD